VTGRNDDLVVTSAGRRVAPSPIEQKLEASQYIRTAVVVRRRAPRPACTAGDRSRPPSGIGRCPTRSVHDVQEPDGAAQVRDLVATAVDEVN